ncbi:UDP-glucose--hexose-1-phosphate uridylyltransferase [Bacillota bacterium Lsc_1132]
MVTTTIFQDIQNLLEYGVSEKLMEPADRIYARNRILAVLGLNEWQDCPPQIGQPPLAEILNSILDWAYENQVLTSNTATERDILDTEIMNCLTPRPSEVIGTFYTKYNEESSEAATDYFYHLSTASNYIRTDRIAKNKVWKAATPYGDIDITINLSKPEKDPQEIALLKNAPSVSYPTCLLCKENEGYKGNLRNPARATHRVIPLSLNGEEWFLQYSPYVYYQEHSIILKKEHVPMKISRQTFDRLLAFIEKFPHYFIGSNADLPIVGGSILTHDHFQGGRYEFAIERAGVSEQVNLDGYPTIKLGIVNWPMSVIRLQGNKDEVAAATEFIWKTWREYSDPAADLLAYSGETPHNTVTPIARRRGALYEMDVVLRNNRTTAEFPDGIFHPHQELHHIKKENIGLIEVMGLAVLPGRLAEELVLVADYLLHPCEKEQWDPSVVKHWDWVQELLKKHRDLTEENVMEILKAEVGAKFTTVLEHAGVFKSTADGKAAFNKFIKHLQTQSSLLN